MKKFAVLFLCVTLPAFAGGPVAPEGWDGSFASRLPNGASCCLPADLNGSGLTEGAFVLVSAEKSEFALFALTYTSNSKAHWQLLERHPVSMLDSFEFSVIPPGRSSQAGIRSCTAPGKCIRYFAPGSGQLLKAEP